MREEHALGPVIGVLCGTDPPTNISSSKSLWIKFRSDEADSAPGFLADFALGASQRRSSHARRLAGMTTRKVTARFSLFPFQRTAT